MTLTFVSRSLKVTSTIAASIAPKLLELKISNLVLGFVSHYAQIIFANSQDVAAWPSITFSSMGNVAFVVYTSGSADRRTLGGRMEVNGRTNVRV